MSVGVTTALVVAGSVAAAGSVAKGVIGANAAGKAANQQVTAGEKAEAFQQQTIDTNQANQKPYLDVGKTSAGKLMDAINNGTFGAGSNPNFKAPTADEARATPGYQFTLNQGERGVNASAAAAGGALSGGAVKASEQYASGLADTTYNDVFNRSIAGYQANLAKQAQEYQQLYQPTALGETAATNLGGQDQQAAVNMGNLMTGVGNAQAAGTIGKANAVSGAITGVTNAATGTLLAPQFGGLGGGGGTGPVNNMLQGSLDGSGYYGRTSGMNLPG